MRKIIIALSAVAFAMTGAVSAQARHHHHHRHAHKSVVKHHVAKVKTMHVKAAKKM